MTPAHEEVCGLCQGAAIVQRAVGIDACPRCTTLSEIDYMQRHHEKPEGQMELQLAGWDEDADENVLPLRRIRGDRS